MTQSQSKVESKNPHTEVYPLESQETLSIVKKKKSYLILLNSRSFSFKATIFIKENGNKYMKKSKQALAKNALCIH